MLRVDKRPDDDEKARPAVVKGAAIVPIASKFWNAERSLRVRRGYHAENVDGGCVEEGGVV